MTDASGSSAFAYAAFGALATEDGPWSDDTITYSYANGRRNGFSLQQLNTSAWTVSYGYDAAGRLQSVASPAGAFVYTYDSGLHSGLNSASALVKNIALPNGAAITNTYDVDLARLSSTKLVNSSRSVLNAHTYDYNELNQRYRQTRTDDSFVEYAYDDFGQLTSALGYEPGGSTNRWHEQFSYSYDLAGNLTNRQQHSLSQSFAVNSLNQLTNQSRSGRMTVSGTTSASATNVTVNTTSAIRYADHTFASTNHSLVNGTNAFTAIAKDGLGRVDTNTVNAYLPDTGVFVYDSNGNMVFDGQKAFEYDDENQLTGITATNGWRSVFAYDGKMRRRVRQEYSWRNGAWVLTNEVRYVYDGNLVIQERDRNNIARVTYTRGKDLSGSLEGAGGIGGLLARSGNTLLTIGNAPMHSCYHADGNGNITMLINAQQVPVARYLYGPFGDTLSAIGPLADVNVYGFSSKERQRSSGLTYYLYRYYAGHVQRWPNRDPIHEFGFLELKGRKLGFHVGSELNLYTFVGNNPISYIDVAGLKKRFGGLTGGKCCNSSDKDQYWLDGDTHKWTKLPPGKCTGTWDDCDGMTCGGGFYYVQELEGGNCKTPGKDCDKYARRRWTPDSQGPDAKSPHDRGAPDNNPPPGYGWGIN